MLNNEPTAQLVEEFSQPDATAVPWAEVAAVLGSSEMFWLSTVRRDGRPHVAPLPAMWLDGKLHICTGAHEQKAKNIEANSRCVLTTGPNSYRAGLDIDGVFLDTEPGHTALVFAATPSKILAFRKDPYSQTRYVL